MRLCVYENGVEGQSQKFTMGNDVKMAGCLVHIYKHGTPTGTMRLELYDENILKRLALADVLLSSLPSGYVHGMFRFDITYPLKAGQTYWFVMNSAGGYSYDANNFFGLVMANGGLSWNGQGGMNLRILKYRNFNRGRA